MSTSILSTARSPTRSILRSVLASRRPFANTFVPHNQASRGTPAAGVPNTPSPFQLTPETLKQQNISEKITRVPLDKRGYTSQTLVAAFGRGLSGKLPDAEKVTWEELFKMDKKKLDTLGLTVQDRRYLLWCLEKFRQGKDPKAFAKEPPPKKTQRGWGPAVRKKPS
ncbi:hypothetical protein CPB86DRAFT_774964 [Serendipita vermifera]|nr:hypothetical protein CPB86DRAFT_774964 [Serendipita vermifera]